MVVKKGETGTYVKWLQQGLHREYPKVCVNLQTDVR